MKMKPGRNIKRKSSASGIDCELLNPDNWVDREWLVPFHDGHAIIHRYRDASDEQALSGPIVFCCHQSKQLFLETYSSSDFLCAEWFGVPADQIISWMEAGVQVIYYVYCAQDIPGRLLATGLSGKHAYQLVNRQSPDEDVPIGSIQILEQIANQTGQNLCETEDKLYPNLLQN